MPSRLVGVIGTSNASPSIAALAFETGRLLALKGCTVLCGGMGGVMAEAARGAASAGGTSIGLLPREASEANPHLTHAIATGLGEARNFVIPHAASVLIAIGGGLGTLSEIAMALRLGKRVIALKTWTAFDEENNPMPVLVAESPEEAVRLALEEPKP
jgi:uncharacterized protein (TIGR00725 family)